MSIKKILKQLQVYVLNKENNLKKRVDKTLKNDEKKEKWFNEIWGNYPRKLKKAVAYKNFMAQIKTPEDLKNITMALVNYKADVEHQRKNGHRDLAWQHGGTWFFRNWLDYVDLKPADNGQPKAGKQGQEWKKQFEGDHPTKAESKKLLDDLKVKLK